jgi:CDP-diacylglycerol--serine O-phosphatidyltransferase
MVLPIFVAIVLFVAVLVSYPWEVLTIGTVIYLASLPVGWLVYRRYERLAMATAAQQEPAQQATAAETPSAVPVGPPSELPEEQRPTRH